MDHIALRISGELEAIAVDEGTRSGARVQLFQAVEAEEHSADRILHQRGDLDAAAVALFDAAAIEGEQILDAGIRWAP